MTEYETAVARYFEAWNATATADRDKAVAAAWTEDGSYTDPSPAFGGETPLPTPRATRAWPP